MSPGVERRALQAVILVAGLVPVGAGLSGVLIGPPAFGGSGNADMASHLAYLSGLLLAIGLAFWACVPTIERRRTVVSLLAAIVVVGGLARLASLGLAGAPDAPHLLALIMELGVTPAIALWQRRMARLAGSARAAGE